MPDGDGDGAGSGVGAGSGAGAGWALGRDVPVDAGFVAGVGRVVVFASVGALALAVGAAAAAIADALEAGVVAVVAVVVALGADEPSAAAVSDAGVFRAPITANAPPPIVTSTATRTMGSIQRRDPAEGSPGTSTGSSA